MKVFLYSVDGLARGCVWVTLTAAHESERERVSVCVRVSEREWEREREREIMSSRPDWILTATFLSEAAFVGIKKDFFLWQNFQTFSFVFNFRRREKAWLETNVAFLSFSEVRKRDKKIKKLSAATTSGQRITQQGENQSRTRNRFWWEMNIRMICCCNKNSVMIEKSTTCHHKQQTTQLIRLIKNADRCLMIRVYLLLNAALNFKLKTRCV